MIHEQHYPYLKDSGLRQELRNTREALVVRRMALTILCLIDFTKRNP